MTNDVGIREVRPIFVNSVVAVYALGHLDVREFLPAAREYLEQELDVRAADFGDQVEHEWWVEVPDTDGFGEYPTLFRACNQGDDRAFPVTVLSLADWKR
jgi:hypothetical protein